MDMEGKVFGKLAVERCLGERLGRFSGRRRRAVMWLCRCSCGDLVEVPEHRLLEGKKKYCDHLKHKSDWAPIREDLPKRLHVLTYNSWRQMKKRCRTINDDHHWPNYGGRGIRVCERWGRSFEAFLADMGDRPDEEYSIERRDVNGDYEPGNCYWATDKVQQRNKRTTRWVEWGGRRRKLVEVCDEEGVGYQSVASRLNLGWSLEEAIRRPVNRHRWRREKNLAA